MSNRPLYVAVPLLNGADLIRHVKGFGVQTTHPPHEMHTTIAYSRKPVDWGLVSPLRTGIILLPSMDRKFTVFPGANVLVLELTSAHFNSRHWHYRNYVGCSYDFDDYRPHITITNNVPSQEVIDNLNANPYTGVLDYGPEMVETIDENREKVIEEDNDTRS